MLDLDLAYILKQYGVEGIEDHLRNIKQWKHFKDNLHGEKDWQSYLKELSRLIDQAKRKGMNNMDQSRIKIGYK